MSKPLVCQSGGNTEDKRTYLNVPHAISKIQTMGKSKRSNSQGSSTKYNREKGWKSNLLIKRLKRHVKFFWMDKTKLFQSLAIYMWVIKP